ncbi:MAG: hypothetical protein GX309_06170 [Clostridiales bacterium]|nr:hypothetical protein [Clostridiales bacterium]
MKTKLIVEEYNDITIDESINEWLDKNNVDVIDIKLINTNDDLLMALIIYK